MCIHILYMFVSLCEDVCVRMCMHIARVCACMCNACVSEYICVCVCVCVCVQMKAANLKIGLRPTVPLKVFIEQASGLSVVRRSRR